MALTDVTKNAFLIIDDQKSIAFFLREELARKTKAPIYLCHTYQDAKKLLAEKADEISVAVCDLNLEDAPNGETLDLLAEHTITTIVLSGSYSEQTRQRVYAHKNVVDYVNKDTPASIRYAVHSILQIRHNVRREVWLLSHENASNHRRLFKQIQQRLFQVRLFNEPKEILEEIKHSEPDFILINGISLFPDLTNFTYEVHEIIDNPNFPVMVLATETEESTAIKLMKHGLNDFCRTTASNEELFARIRQNILQTENMRKIRRISQEDFLTGIPNRRYFLEFAQKRMQEVKEPFFFFVAMIDIDHFKSINDQYGHPVGDEAIQFTSKLIAEVFDGQVFGRLGGEEFCVLGEVKDAADAEALCEKLRTRIETESTTHFEFSFTVSQGLTFSGSSLTQAILSADKALYQAKEGGRNQTRVSFF